MIKRSRLESRDICLKGRDNEPLAYLLRQWKIPENYHRFQKWVALIISQIFILPRCQSSSWQRWNLGLGGFVQGATPNQKTLYKKRLKPVEPVNRKNTTTLVNEHSWLENGPGMKMIFLVTMGIFQPASAVLVYQSQRIIWNLNITLLKRKHIWSKPRHVPPFRVVDSTVSQDFFHQPSPVLKHLCW